MWVALDTSLTGTAIAVIDDDGSYRTERCSTSGTDSASHADTMRRMTRIERWLRGQLEDLGRVDLTIGIEGPSLSPQRTGRDHERAGLWWRLLTRASLYAEDDVVVVAPKSRAKYATGSGNGTKDQVLIATTRHYPLFTGTTNDEADALVIAAMLARLDGHPIDDLPATHTVALDKLRKGA